MNRLSSKGKFCLFLGLVASFIYFVVGHFIALPDIVQGFLCGISIGCYGMAIYSRNHDLDKLREWKRKTFLRR